MYILSYYNIGDIIYKVCFNLFGMFFLWKKYRIIGILMDDKQSDYFWYGFIKSNIKENLLKEDFKEDSDYLCQSDIRNSLRYLFITE